MTEVNTNNKETTEMTEETMTIEGILKDLDDGKVSKSEAFRVMYTMGMPVGQIAKATDSHYSFVYGVISGTFGTVGRGNKKASKSDRIRELADEGKTPGEIAKELNSNYSFVHSVVKKHRMMQEQAGK